MSPTDIYTTLRIITDYVTRYEGEMRIAIGLMGIGFGLRIWAAMTERKGSQ